MDPTLQDLQDPIPFLQVFAYRFRHGLINTSQRPVRSRTVEGALRSVGQTLASVGSPDPRFTAQGKLDFRLKRMLAGYSRQDDPRHGSNPSPYRYFNMSWHKPNLPMTPSTKPWPT